MFVSLSLDREKFEKEKERFIKKNKKMRGEEDAYLIEGEGEKLDELSIQDDELTLFIKFGPKREHNALLTIPLKVSDVRYLLKELVRITSQLGGSQMVKEVKESGTGAVVYVPKEWKGEEVAVTKK